MKRTPNSRSSLFTGLFLGLLYPSAPLRQWLKYLLVILIVLGLVVSLMPATELQSRILTYDKVVHAAAFLGFAFLLDRAVNRSFLCWQMPMLLAYGLLIECLQFTLPWRSFSLWDWLADAIGLLVYGLVCRKWLNIRPERST